MTLDCDLFFHVIARICQLCLCSDMIHEMKKGTYEPTPLLSHGSFNLPHHILVVREELAFGDAVNYTRQGNGLQHSGINVMTVAGLVPLSPGSQTLCLN